MTGQRTAPPWAGPFAAALARRTRSTGMAYAAAAAVAVPALRILDQSLDPASGPAFWPVRLTVAAVVAVAWVPDLLFPHPRAARWAALVSAVAVQLGAAWMLPRATAGQAAYLVLLLLTPVAVTLLVRWHWRYPALVNGISLVAVVTAHLTAPPGHGVPGGLAGTLALLAVVSALGQAAHRTLYRAACGEFAARADAGQARDEAEAARAEAVAARAEAGAQRERNLELLVELERLSREDGLTGVANRRAFDAALQLAITLARETGSTVGLVLMDLDHFKAVNDSFGQEAGDDVLREVARRMRDDVRDRDLVARYGGEEFAVLLPGIAAPRLEEAVDSLRRRLALAATDDRPAVTVSAGAALFPRDGGDPASLLESAEAALGAAKTGGRDRSVIAHGLLPGEAVPDGPLPSLTS